MDSQHNLSKLADDPIKLGVGVVLIIVMCGGLVEVWKLHEKRKQEEQARQVCEQMLRGRNLILKKIERGEKVSPLEAAGAYQLGVMTGGSCEPNK